MTDFLNTNYGCHEYFKDSSYKRFHRFHQDDSYLLFNYSLGGDSCCCHGCCSGAGLFGRGLLGGGLFGGDWRGLLGILGGGLAVGGLFGLGKLIFSGGLARKEKPDNEGNPDDKLKVKDNTDIGGQSKGIADLQAKIKEQQNKLADLQAEKDKLDETVLSLATRLDELENANKPQSGPVVDGGAEDDFDTTLASGNIDDIIGLLNNEDLTEEQITEVLDKFKDLLGSLSGADKLKYATNDDLDPRLLAIVRESYYESGYKNATLDELKATGAVVERAHDASGGPDDVINQKGSSITFDADCKPTIVINDLYQNDENKLFKATYAFVKESSTGELIFKSSRNNQLYIAQIKNGKISLMQYAYHTGHGVSDVTEDNYNKESV